MIGHIRIVWYTWSRNIADVILLYQINYRGEQTCLHNLIISNLHVITRFLIAFALVGRGVCVHIFILLCALYGDVIKRAEKIPLIFLGRRHQFYRANMRILWICMYDIDGFYIAAYVLSSRFESDQKTL